MTIKQVEDKLTDLVHRQPFVPFVVELANGEKLTIPRPPAFDESGAVLIGLDGCFVEFEFKNVCAIRPYTVEAIA